MTKSNFLLSVEPTEGKTFRHGYHLGTIEEIAREIAVQTFASRNAYGLPTRTVALIRDELVFNVFDGRWNSDPCYDNQLPDVPYAD